MNQGHGDWEENPVSGLLGVRVRGERWSLLLLPLYYQTCVFWLWERQKHTICFVCWFKHMLHCCEIEPSFSLLFPSWHHDWIGHFFFRSSLLLLGDGVLAEMSEFHGSKHLTTPLVLSISSLIKYSVILITKVIRHFLSLFLVALAEAYGQGKQVHFQDT